jgi:hypothetical protein
MYSDKKILIMYIIFNIVFILLINVFSVPEGKNYNLYMFYTLCCLAALNIFSLFFLLYEKKFLISLIDVFVIIFIAIYIVSGSG